MTEMYKRIKELCEENHMTVSQMCKELSIRAEQRQDGTTFLREFYKDSEQIWSERTISYIWQGRRF